MAPWLHHGGDYPCKLSSGCPGSLPESSKTQNVVLGSLEEVEIKDIGEIDHEVELLRLSCRCSSAFQKKWSLPYQKLDEENIGSRRSLVLVLRTTKLISPYCPHELDARYAPYLRLGATRTVMGRGMLPAALVAAILIPLRFVARMLVLVVNYVVCRVCTLGVGGPGRAVPASRVDEGRRAEVARSLSRPMLFVFGFYWIRVTLHHRGLPSAVVSTQMRPSYASTLRRLCISSVLSDTLVSTYKMRVFTTRIWSTEFRGGYCVHWY